ncbi:MAG: hydroxymethylglutaryl-CoA reductase, degradative [Anaerolineales bacterium]|nr:hydroxymethylglutaryl-CoA reductase, degradative [Anaerolineales bacterium]
MTSTDSRTTTGQTTSRLPGFYDLGTQQRLQELAVIAEMSAEHKAVINGTAGLTPEQADHMIENAVGVYGLPLGVAANFVVNDREVIVPMAIEEPSVVAGASFMAKLARAGGGFRAECSPPEMIGQLQILDLDDVAETKHSLLEQKAELLGAVEDIDPVITQLGGGVRDLEVRIIRNSPIGSFLVVHLIYDTRDAMGANAINTAVEALAPLLEQKTGGRVHLRILSNLADRRLARAEVCIPTRELAFGSYSGERVRDGIIEAWAFAASDSYRAATHNKGIMNGVDAVVIATGNDWRAIEAGAHAFAARSGHYGSLSRWSVDDEGNLHGELEMPMAVGIVGGATSVHPCARAALQLLRVRSSVELAEIIVSVGLAQNLAALRALSTEGIQRGHMGLHARQVAIAAGAQGDEVERLARVMVVESKIRVDRARELLQSPDQLKWDSRRLEADDD